jgi:hypothetical protein
METKISNLDKCCNGKLLFATEEYNRWQQNMEHLEEFNLIQK